MDAKVWQRYVAVACSQAWKLDVRATEEVLRCIETVIAATPTAGSASIRVFLEAGVGELTIDRGGEMIRVGLRKSVSATGRPCAFVETVDEPIMEDVRRRPV